MSGEGLTVREGKTLKEDKGGDEGDDGSGEGRRDDG